MVTRLAARARFLGGFAATLFIALAGALGAQQPDSARRDSLPAVLVGRVTDSTGVGLAGAEITLHKSEKISAVTGDSGDFRLAGLPAGTSVFNVRRLGFQPASFTAVLKGGKTHRATMKLTANALALPSVAVSDTMNKTHWLDQFERRRSTSRGTFLTRADIVKRSARVGSDIVRTVPGIRVVPGRGSNLNQVTMTRGAGGRPCFPTMYVHGMPYSGVIDDFTADDIEALEIYVGISEIPPELDKNGRGVCGVIVVWTRDPRRPPV
ncbi:MAG TPA: carboxypeptidase regulatory-like domain-containing protein [Gemmatimonadaceae bacterium]